MRKLNVIAIVTIILSVHMLTACVQNTSDSEESTVIDLPTSKHESEENKNVKDTITLKEDSHNNERISDVSEESIKSLSENDSINNIFQEIDNRVSWIIERSEDITSVADEEFEDYYIEGELVKRSFFNDFGNESYAIYDLYYDRHGYLVFAEIAHYRSYLYSVYFEDELAMYIYWDENSKLNGDVNFIESLLEDDNDYSVILEDIELIQDYAH